jgi:hypothetical protein
MRIVRLFWAGVEINAPKIARDGFTVMGASSHLARARIDASVWSGFLVGAGLSGMAGSRFRMWGPRSSLFRHSCIGSVQRVRHTINREEDYIFDLRGCAAQCRPVSIEVSMKVKRVI